MDIGTFFVQQAIVHKIPEARLDQKDDIPPTLADVPSELDVPLKTYFQRRIRTSLQNSFGAIWDPDITSPVPGLIVDFFNEEGDNFVEVSRNVAKHLHLSQNGSSPSGLVAVVDGTIGSGDALGRCLVILKLEMEEGIHAELVGPEGQRRFQIELEEVTLTEKTRVFKASLFPRAHAPGELAGVVSDDQNDAMTARREVARYFLSQFLGCKIAETPDIATKRYRDAAEDYFNSIDDDDKKLRYEMALLSDLQNQAPVINPETFANLHLEVEDRDAFVARFKEADGSVRIIEKDIGLVRSRVDRSWIELNNGLRIVGPPETVEAAMRALRVAKDPQGNQIINADIKRMK